MSVPVAHNFMLRACFQIKTQSRGGSPDLFMDGFSRATIGRGPCPDSFADVQKTI